MQTANLKNLARNVVMSKRKVYFSEDQFETLFNFVSEHVDSLVQASIDYNDSEILNANESLLDVHEVLEEASKWVLLEDDDG